MIRQLCLRLLALALFACPWVGVGLSELLLGRRLGMGIQLALAACVLAVALLLLREGWSVLARVPDGRWLAIAFAWTIGGATASWGLDNVGLAGEIPWAKSAKQLLVLALYGCCFLLPLLLSPRRGEQQLLERALSAGLMLSAVYGLLQALHHQLPLPAMDTVDRWCSSNSSIAAGSHELYLGQRFVGIARVRAGACEPLYFGSYLLAALPLVVASAVRQRGFGRWWRVVAAAAGGVALVLTFSRGVYAAALLLMALLAWGWRSGRVPAPGWNWRIASTLAVASLLLLAFFTQGAPWRLPLLLWDRMAQTLQTHDMSNLTRLYGWRAALAAFQERPLQGVGWGEFGFHYYRLAPPGGAGAHFGWPMTNSLPLRVLAETGLVGLLLWAWALRGAVEALFRKTSDSRSFLFAAICTASLLQLLSSSQLQLPHLWLLGGFSLLAARAEGSVV